jgi:hypothetical protein
MARYFAFEALQSFFVATEIGTHRVAHFLPRAQSVIGDFATVFERVSSWKVCYK